MNTSTNLTIIILIGSIFFLLTIVIFLLLYTFILRVANNGRVAYITKKSLEWEALLFEYLESNNNFNILKFSIKHDDWIIFGEFIENFLVDIKGEEADKIINLLWKMEYYKYLWKALKKNNPWEKAYAAYYMGLMKFKLAEKDLIKLTEDKHEIVAISALESINKIGTENIRQIIKSVLLNKTLSDNNIYSIMLNYSHNYDNDLIALLDDKELDDSSKRIIIDILVARECFESIDPILNLAKTNNNHEIIIGAIKAVGEFGNKNASDFLTNNIGSENWIIRSQSVKALGKTADESIIPYLTHILMIDENFWVKLYSAQSIFMFGNVGIQKLTMFLDNTGELKSDLLPKVENADMLKNILYYVLYENLENQSYLRN